MEQMMPRVISVSQLNRYVKSLLDEDLALRQVLLSGEISNFTDHYRSGHLYFSLKDGGSAVKAVMFASAASRLRFKPADGMQVIVRGRVTLYEQTGQYQFYVEEMQPDGLGALNLAFEKLKEKLEREGLFAHKRPLPSYPGVVGVITSPTGAAVRDILQILGRRWPAAQVLFCPVLVQGDNAAEQIASAIEKMNHDARAQVLIVGRGGGSAEDLWAFNEERVARAVAASRIPVISAVGHETDFTICDFAADLRAPTPSAAAELAVPDRLEEVRRIRIFQDRLEQAMDKELAFCQSRFHAFIERPVLKRPKEWLQGNRIRIDGLEERLRSVMNTVGAEKKSALAVLIGKLDGLSPLKTLERGYAVVQREGKPIVQAVSLKNDDVVSVCFADGRARCRVESVHLEEKKNG